MEQLNQLYDENVAEPYFSLEEPNQGLSQGLDHGQKQGLTQSVALVITGCSPLLLSTVNAMLWMSPVQPAKVFAYHDEALNWCVRNTK